MRALLKFGIIFFSVLICCEVPALFSNCCSPIFPHQIYIGPEVCYFHRSIEGAKQDGVLFGARTGYDYIKGNCFYAGFEGVYLSGRLHGHSDINGKLKSKFRDAEFEGRLGYTLFRDCGRQVYLTPFIGGGYVDERNNFINPSLLTAHYNMHYGYVCAGFLSSIHLCPRFDFGINFKTKYMINARNDVTHDPEYEDVVMHVKNEFHYRVELPLTYRIYDEFYLRLVPFYEYRLFGGKVNFPFDFHETREHLAGATLKLMYCL